MDLLAHLATGFIALFQKGGTVFAGLVTGIIPTLVVLITAVNSLIGLVGEEKVNNIAKMCTGNIILRYTIFPVIAVFFLTNPICYSFGRFLPEKYKPAFQDASISFVHPITGLFPHANSAELFVWMGISQGITTLGLPLGELAVRYFITGVIVILMRGIITEKATLYMFRKNGISVD
ncbi:PTS glucitol/sorbitol transporter subunit IIC [Propionispora vibrioides]|jgi:PTS system glucitol/sorbitol-specific IIC component|uniref:PTS system, glucitol/sorbitol-specific IIC component n=1 Tax=Propionispora vibrioides TaxID=112903 RepID=A0A1H8TM77_9FIRM|nr:PTS glucitol/sorbitol transporter subunit IIC [Propionispora vibrioides]SEO91568.1 PTS system, glucitol/sorbitol-specific IIC component [Propionispora vibrioides]